MTAPQHNGQYDNGPKGSTIPEYAIQPAKEYFKEKAAGKITPDGIIEDTNKLLRQAERTGTVTGEQLLNEAPEQMDWLINNICPRVGMGTLAGGSDLGKSALLRQLGIDIATNNSHWLGFKLNPKYNSAIICCTEDDSSAVKYLLSKQAKDYKPLQLRNLRFIFDYENLPEDVSKELDRNPADIVKIDCFSDAFGGDLKDTSKIRAYLSIWQQIAVKYECFIMFLHHTGKRTEDKEPSKNNLLSGQGFEAKMRLVIELRADLMQPNYRHFCIVKGNYLPANMKRESYVLKFDEASFTFANTGERTPFELLVKNYEDGSRAKYEQAKELHEKGFSCEKIAEQMGYGNKSSISRLLEKGQKNDW